jgi:site-specific DNA recombinase
MNVKQTKQGSGPLRAVLYARTSKDDALNATSSIQGQLDLCREYAQKKDWTVVAELADDGVSGAAWNAPALSEALEMAQAGAFDVLVTRELDRLARGLAKQLVIESEVTAAGVELAYVLGDYADTPEGALMKNIRAVISEYERLKIGERMTRGKRRKVREGNAVTNNHPPFGYRQEVDGKTTRLVIDEATAATVRLIFRLYVDEGLSINGITRRLGELGIPTAADLGLTTGAASQKQKAYGAWGTSVVAKLLKNETYAGTYRFGKTNGDAENLIAVQVPAIVDADTFARAQARRALNVQYARRNTKYPYLVGRRVVCGACGAAAQASTAASGDGAHKYAYYLCSAAHMPLSYARTCKQSTRFAADRVDAAVWDWVRAYLADPEKLAQGLAAYQAERDQASAPLRERISLLDKRIGDKRQQLDKLLDLYLGGDFPKEMLTERKQRLTDTIAALERERADSDAQLTADALSDDDVQSMFAFAAEVAEGLEAADEDFAMRRRIIELLDVRVTLAIEDGEKVIYPRCRFWDGGRLSIAYTSSDIRASQSSPAQPTRAGWPPARCRSRWWRVA